MVMSNLINSMIQKELEQKVVRTWLSGSNSRSLPKSILMTIPHEYCKQYNLDKPTNVLVVPTEQGLLIKKLEVKA